MNEQEMFAMQEALMAQMQGENEDIYIDEEEDDDEEDNNAQGGGIRGFINNLMGWRGDNNNN